MLGLIIVAATVLQTISSQGPPPFPPHFPEQCRRPPQDGGNPQECCKIPPIFAEEDFKECGFTKAGENEPPTRRGPPDCSKQQCILKKNGLLNDESRLDSEKAKEYLGKWGESTDLKPAVEAVIENCFGKERLPGPPHICEENKIFFCMKATLFSHCPESSAWEKSDTCTKLKDHMQECAPYFMPPPPPKE